MTGRVAGERVAGERVAPSASHPRAPIGAAVLNWRGAALTEACLASVTRTLQPGDGALVVDNGSGGHELEDLRQRIGSDVELVALGTNRGVPAGYNAALRWGRSRGFDAVLLLNNDVILEDAGSLEAMAAALAPDVAAVGPVVLASDGSIASAGGRMDPRWGSVGHLASPHGVDPYPVAWLDGSAMLVNLRAVDAVGGFDEDYFLYWEEVDWCQRATGRGFRCLVAPSARITHLGSATATPATVDRYMLRNALLFARKRPDRSAGARYLVRHLLRTLPGRIRREGLAQGRLRAQLRLAFAAVAWNVRDARRNGLWRRSLGPGLGPRAGGD